jgi:hypothetical protein
MSTDLRQITHDDEKFVQLTTEAQMLWVVLLSGPHRTTLPGLQKGDVLTLAAIRRRSVETVRDAFGEIVTLGMAKHDPDRRVILLPRFGKYAPKPNGNMLRGWYRRWVEVPECRLKLEWFQLFAERFEPEMKVASQDVSRAWQQTFGLVLLRGIAAKGGVQGTLPLGRQEGRADVQVAGEGNSHSWVPKGFGNGSERVAEPFAKGSGMVSQGFGNGFSEPQIQKENHTLGIPSSMVPKGFRNGSETHVRRKTDDGIAKRVSGGLEGVQGEDGAFQHEQNSAPGSDAATDSAAELAERTRLAAQKRDWLRR